MPAVGSMNQNMNFLYGAAGKKFRGEGATVHSKKAYQELELWFPWFLTWALYGDELLASLHTHWPLYSQEESPPVPVWTLWNREKSVVPARNQTMISWLSSPYLSHYTYYTILAPSKIFVFNIRKNVLFVP